MLLAAGVAIVALAVLTGCINLNASQTTALNAMNHDRNVNHLATLPVQAQAQAKAQAWANNLAAKGYIYHSNLPTGYSSGWCSLGENVGRGGSVAQVETAYMKSPEHRANILDGRWAGVGVGVAVSANGTTFTVQEFYKGGGCTGS